jgi:iron complex transport system substrate-binding protein
MRVSETRRRVTSASALPVAVAVLAVMSSVWIGATLPDAALATAPDGSRHRATGRAGPGCERVSPQHARVASAALLSDEILLELIDRDRWAAISYVVDWPFAAAVVGRVDPTIPRTAGTAEQLLGIGADLVFASEYTGAGALAAQLASAGRCVIELAAPRTIEELFAVISRIGQATGTGGRAAALRARLEEQLARWPRPHGVARRPTALALQGLRVFASDTLQGNCLGRAGPRNAADALGLHGTPLLPSEALLARELDLLFVAAPVPALALAKWEHLPSGVPWQATPVARRGRIFAVPEAWMSSLSHHALRAGQAYAEAAWSDPWRR